MYRSRTRAVQSILTFPGHQYLFIKNNNIKLSMSLSIMYRFTISLR